MADDRHYVPSEYYQLDDISGFKVRSSRTRQQWDGRITTPPHFSPRQPQDLVVGVLDNQSVPSPRPRQQNQFTIVETWVTAPTSRGSYTIPVASTVGWTVGDVAQIMLDVGENFTSPVISLSGNTMQLMFPLAGTVGGNLGDPIENAVLDLGPTSMSRILVLDDQNYDILNYNVLGSTGSLIFTLNSPNTGILNQNVLGA